MKYTRTRLISASALALLMSGGTLAAEGTSNSSLIDTPRPAERSEMHPHIGLFAGAASSNGDGYRTDPSFMIDAGFQPIIPISFALQTQYNPSSIDLPGANVDFNTTNILLKETLNFGGTVPILRHSYIGTKTGVAVYSGDVETKTYAALGGVLGFDIPVSTERVSLGAEGTYLGVLGPDESTPDQASVLGAMKYWF